MKNVTITIIAVMATLVALTATAERKIWMYSNQGNHISMDVTELDSISFEEPGYLTLTPTSKSLEYEGGRFTVSIETNKEWTASVNDKTALIISKESGSGDDEISVLASQNTDEKSYSAILTITLSNGQYGQVIVTVDGKLEPEATIKDICGNTYPIVTIGTQTWMAENMKCNKYDTESEAYNASWLVSNTIPTSNDAVYTPYYADATDKSKWSSTEDAKNLNNEQIEKLGWLYNWASTVGVQNGQSQSTAFSGNRQGICPNGWHVPSRDEYQSLYDYIYKDQQLSSNKVAKYLKTTSGWYDEGDGSNNYSFSTLPAGYAKGNFVDDIGTNAGFWTTTSYNSGHAYDRGFIYYDDIFYDDSYGYKNVAFSVRCIKNEEATVKDICGNTYPIVTIGTQTWMAENLKCNQYDTESEAYNASWLVSNTIPTSNDAVYTPYYTDATDKTKWSSTEYAGNLSNEQISKLGYLYNWAATVGISNGQDQTSTFADNRQGICPNGWHVPSKAEWETLYDYICNSKALSSNSVGQYLKTTSGWYNNGNGTDSYGFAALPAGYYSSVDHVGYGTDFYTTTPSENDSNSAYIRHINYDHDYLYGHDGSKDDGRSVRCLKD